MHSVQREWHNPHLQLTGAGVLAPQGPPQLKCRSLNGRYKRIGMKRIPRDPEKFEVIDLFAAIGLQQGFSLHGEGSKSKFLDRISSSLTANRDNPIILHGRRVEEMFGYVAASLGQCAAIKREDAGELYVADTRLQIPDYRLITEQGYEFLVEVKNCHKETTPYVFKDSYIDRLKRYAALFKRELKVAFYWSRWNFWMLVSADKIPFDGRRYSISMEQAMKMNEMATIGDCMIGTTPPLVFKVHTDPSKPRVVGSDGRVKFTIGSVELYCAGNRIEDRTEKNLAFYLMLYGDWPSKKPTAQIEEGTLIAIDFVAEPIQDTPGQGFEMIGWLSKMIARRYNYLTSSEQGIDRLSPNADPGSLGVAIPRDYKSKQLPLWIFELTPSPED